MKNTNMKKSSIFLIANMLCCSTYGMRDEKAFIALEHKHFNIKEACCAFAQSILPQHKNLVITELKNLITEKKRFPVYCSLPDELKNEMDSLLHKIRTWSWFEQWGLAYAQYMILEIKETGENKDILKDAISILNNSIDHCSKKLMPKEEDDVRGCDGALCMMYFILKSLGESIDEHTVDSLLTSLEFSKDDYRLNPCKICNQRGMVNTFWWNSEHPNIHRYCYSLLTSMQFYAKSIEFDAVAKQGRYDFSGEFDFLLSCACGEYCKIYGDYGFQRFISYLQEELQQHKEKSVLEYLLTHGKKEYVLLCKKVFTKFDRRNQAMLKTLEEVKKVEEQEQRDLELLKTGFLLEDKKDGGN